MDDGSKRIIEMLQRDHVSPDSKSGDQEIVIDGRRMKPEDAVYDLHDVLEDPVASEDKKDQEIIVIDGRVYERVARPDEMVFYLTDVAEEGPHHDEVMQKVSEITERVAREMIPGIAERIIREEIEKLKE